MKRIVIVAIAIALVGCGDQITQHQPVSVLPDGLKDCQFFNVSDKGVGSMKVVRCPNSSTSVRYASGKSSADSVVIDGSPAAPPKPVIETITVNGKVYSREVK